MVPPSDAYPGPYLPRIGGDTIAAVAAQLIANAFAGGGEDTGGQTLTSFLDDRRSCCTLITFSVLALLRSAKELGSSVKISWRRYTSSSIESTTFNTASTNDEALS